MPRHETVLRAFVASPSDVAEERTLLEDVVRDLNSTWSRHLGIRLELVSWETSVVPAAGPDPQAVINEQIGDDYDIFVGILWARFGAPTHESKSGTQEEFERAYERFQKDPENLRIMFYFKEAPINHFNADLDQARLVVDFRRQLQGKALYAVFETRTEFETKLRMHLSRQVQEWSKTWGRGDSATAIPQAAATKQPTQREIQAEPEADSEDLGFIDLLEIGQDRMEKASEIAQRITGALEALGTKFGEHTEEIARVAAGGPPPDFRQLKRITNRAGHDMAFFAQETEPNATLFVGAYTEGMDALSRAVSVFGENAGDDGVESLTLALIHIRDAGSTIDKCQEAVRNFREVVRGLPRATTEFNRAKRKTVSMLTRFDGEIARAKTATVEVETVLQSLLGEDSSG